MIRVGSCFQLWYLITVTHLEGNRSGEQNATMAGRLCIAFL